MTYKEGMSEDILYNLKKKNPTMTFNDNIFNEALIVIEESCIAINNKELSDLGLTSPKRNRTILQDRDFIREKNYNKEELKQFLELNKSLMNDDQRSVYIEIMRIISQNNGGIYFLDAPGGTGKTFLINIYSLKFE